ncbi:MAG: hypothetical protein JWR26_4871 [Pedosphaera sp.]|nr:hypothetical protein [Pedosphaera sp.]
MRKRSRITFSLLLVALVGGIAWLAFRPSEPRYKGRRLSAWLEDLNEARPGPQFDEAREAISQMGSNSLPRIISMLRARDSLSKQRLMKWAGEHHMFESAFEPVQKSQHHAVIACFVLGPKAAPAIPALIAFLNEGNVGTGVGQTLAKMGPEALGPLIGSLSNRDDLVRREVAYSLGDFQSNAPMVVPVLIQCLKDKASSVRFFAAVSLAHLAKEPTVAIPALVGALNDEDNTVRYTACLAIGEFRQQAQSATAPLLTLLEDADPEIRVAAAMVLARIHPEDPSMVEKVLPFLIKDLEDKPDLNPQNGHYSRDFRPGVISVLAECGPLARPAEPALVKCLNDAESFIREAAAKALKAIDLEAAEKAGVK